MPHSTLEKSLLQAEGLLGLSLTVVDHRGIFHSPEAQAILSPLRQSHRKNPICHSAFRTKECVAHCRHAMNARAVREKKTFAHSCWLGVREIVVPLFRGETFCGNLFAGVWRSSPSKVVSAERRVSESTRKLFSELPVYENSQSDRLAGVLDLVAKGILFEIAEAFPVNPPGEGVKERIRRFVNEKASEPLSLSDLAQHLERSASRTSHLVRKWFGISFRELLRDTRMSRARYLLRNSELSLGEIADQCGLANVYHFSREFKKHSGLPPGKYRSQEAREKPET